MYLDDVVIYSNTWVEHLQWTFEKIQKTRLTLNVAKCEWAMQETSYLGYHLGNVQLYPQGDKLEAICQNPKPNTKKEVRSFLSFVGWYRRFIPSFPPLQPP